MAFARSALWVNWDPRYARLLELAEACAVPARRSCRTGVYPVMAVRHHLRAELVRKLLARHELGAHNCR
ncbi:MAG TPA: hypothetical protein VK162_19740 [Streptosporangiaceae bacterium]|nr:hypothetical protein [Streptosporangiaceae bacterium]